MTACRLTLAALAVALSLTTQAQALVLRGRVVDLDGKPATDARLQIVGHAPRLAIRTPSGEFEQPLAGEPAQVEIAVIDGSLEVLYPLDGRVAVPRDESVIVTVVVDKHERASINELLAARLVRLEAALDANGVRYDAARDSLSRALEQIMGRLDLDEASLRRSVTFQREQAATAPEILRTVDTYLRELKDLRDGFRHFAPLAVRERAALDALQMAMQEYSAAFTALSDNRRAFASKILEYWPAPRDEVVAGKLADVYLEAVENIHEPLILPLNPPLIVLQRAHGDQRPGRDEIAAAAAEIVAAAADIDRRLPALEQRARELHDALGR